MPRGGGSCEAVSKQELQRTVQANVGQRGRTGSARLARRRAEAQETVVGLMRRREPLKRVEQRRRILRQVARKGRDLRLTIKTVLAQRLTGERRAGDDRQLVAPARSRRLFRGTHRRERDDINRRAGKFCALDGAL